MLPEILLAILVVLSGMVSGMKLCPPASEIAPCTCLDGYGDFDVNCDASKSDGQKIRSILEHISTFGNIMFMRVSNINDTFQTIPEDFMVGNQVTALYLSCSHPHTVRAPVLKFDSRAFTSPDGTCSIIGDFQIQNCNMGHMDAGAFQNCSQMVNLMIWNSNVKSFSNVPPLSSLKTLNIWSDSADMWKGSRGLVDVNITAANLPNMTTLTLRGGRLEADDVAFISQLKSVQVINLENNNLSEPPDLSLVNTLTKFYMSVDLFAPNISIYLPTAQVGGLHFRIVNYKLEETFSIGTLQGYFGTVTISFYLQLDSFEESIFAEPLKEGATIVLNKYYKFPCGCDIAWLVREPELMRGIIGDMCQSGIPFNKLNPDDFSCCPNCFKI